MTNNTMKRTRKAMTIAITVFAMAVFTACASTGDDGAVQPKEIVATKAVVTTTAETKATTTEDVTTLEKKMDAEPKTTTTEAVTDSEPETTTTEVTEPASNPDGLYPMPECFRMKVEEYSGGKVTNVYMDQEYGTYAAQTDNGQKYIYYIGKKENYESEVMTNIDVYMLSESTVPGYDGIVVYAPKE